MEIYDSMQKFDNQEIVKCVTKYYDLEDNTAVYLCWLANRIGNLKEFNIKA